VNGPVFLRNKRANRLSPLHSAARHGPARAPLSIRAAHLSHSIGEILYPTHPASTRRACCGIHQPSRPPAVASQCRCGLPWATFVNVHPENLLRSIGSISILSVSAPSSNLALAALLPAAAASAAFASFSPSFFPFSYPLRLGNRTLPGFESHRQMRGDFPLPPVRIARQLHRVAVLALSAGR